MRDSLRVLVKLAQRECFPTELRDNKIATLPSTKGLNSLDAFVDEEGILRVGGRLRNTAFPQDKKHPMILLAKHRFTKLILKNEHLRLLHAAPQALLASIREQFWIVGGRNLAKRIVHECIV